MIKGVNSTVIEKDEENEEGSIDSEEDFDMSDEDDDEELEVEKESGKENAVSVNSSDDDEEEDDVDEGMAYSFILNSCTIVYYSSTICVFIL